MSEMILCSSCRRKLQIPEALAGHQVQCPTCGATFIASLPIQAGASEELEGSSIDRHETRLPGDEWRPEDEFGERKAFRRDGKPHRGGLILTLGILGLGCGLCGAAAWAMGSADLDAMQTGSMDPSGKEMTQAGRMCGICGSILLAIQIMACLLFVFVGGRI